MNFRTQSCYGLKNEKITLNLKKAVLQSGWNGLSETN